MDHVFERRGDSIVCSACGFVAPRKTAVNAHWNGCPAEDGKTPDERKADRAAKEAEAADKLGVTLEDAAHYAEALFRWAMHGFPSRSDDEVASILAVCQACDKSKDSAFGCEFHKGCCFGGWRANPVNKCPEGKW